MPVEVVTMFTAARMLQIENESVVSGTVVDGHLILETREGEQIDAGVVEGPPGTSSAPLMFEQTFAVPTNPWVVNHDLGGLPVNVILLDNNGEEFIGDVTNQSTTQVTVEWASPTVGTIRLFR